MVSIRDVAREANVSTATVSRVVNRSPKTSDEINTRVWQAIRALGYRPVVGRQSASTIGAVVSDVSEPFFGQMLKGIDKVARDHNKQLLIHNGHYSAQSEYDAIERLIGNCEYAIVHSKWLADDVLVDFAEQIPGFVVINRYIAAMAQRCVALDNVRGGYIATGHLTGKGHRHIGYLCSEQGIDDSNDRLAGHRQAMQEAGLAIDERYIIPCPPSEEGGIEGANRLLATGLPLTAIVTYNDIMAAGVLCVLQENNIPCPQEISVIGFDDLHLARHLYPRLSTVRYPIGMIAERATLLSLQLHARKQDNHLAGKAILTPTLVERNSVWCI